ncbi:response regulator [Calycomorphotria hydatis]|uniref:Uncharacterized protein n=1 Tax=Calycomorphotria hydatis TaxID=2528027 RepID=A0A517T6V0_9PLAN|nr:hypothetical protein [Calycomorphotria hydatis]QDT64102.1 hypothetical protein V22_13330 [Calycomorphotria hydatis]
MVYRIDIVKKKYDAYVYKALLEYLGPFDVRVYEWPSDWLDADLWDADCLLIGEIYVFKVGTTNYESGLWLTCLLRQLHRSDMPIVMLTSESVEDLALQCGVTEFVSTRSRLIRAKVICQPSAAACREVSSGKTRWLCDAPS